MSAVPFAGHDTPNTTSIAGDGKPKQKFNEGITLAIVAAILTGIVLLVLLCEKTARRYCCAGRHGHHSHLDPERQHPLRAPAIITSSLDGAKDPKPAEDRTETLPTPDIAETLPSASRPSTPLDSLDGAESLRHSLLLSVEALNALERRRNAATLPSDAETAICGFAPAARRGNRTE